MTDGKVTIGKYIIDHRDDHNWCISVKQLAESGKYKSEMVEFTKGYYPTLTILAKDMLNKLVGDKVDELDPMFDNATSIIKAIKESEQVIVNALGGK